MRYQTHLSKLMEGIFTILKENGGLKFFERVRSPGTLQRPRFRISYAASNYPHFSHTEANICDHYFIAVKPL